MENSNTTVPVITVKITAEELKQVIDGKHDSLLPTIKSRAREFAALNLPEAGAPSLEPFIDFIRALFGAILNDTALHLANVVRTSLASLDIFVMRQKIREIKLKINTLTNQLEALKRDSEKYLGKRTWKEYEKLNLILNVVSCIEILSYILSFLSLGDSFLLAFVFGILIGGGQTLGIKYICLWLRDGAGANLAVLTKRLVWGGVVLVATGLGLLRYMTVRAEDSNGFAQSLFAPFIFILISYFLISVIALYIYHNYPDNAEKEAMKRAIALQDDISEKEKELGDLQKQLQDYNEQINHSAQVHMLLRQLADDLYHRTNKLFKHACSEYKHENRIARTDNVTPQCFAVEVADLERPQYEEWENAQIDPKQLIGTNA